VRFDSALKPAGSRTRYRHIWYISVYLGLLCWNQGRYCVVRRLNAPRWHNGPACVKTHVNHSRHWTRHTFVSKPTEVDLSRVRGASVGFRAARSSHKLKRESLDCDPSNYSSCIRPICSHIPIEFSPSRNSAIQSADPKNPTIEPNMKWIGWPLGPCGDMAL